MLYILYKNRTVRFVFIASIIIKLFFSAFFHSELLSQLFYPFVRNFLDHVHDPWTFYVDHGLPRDAFPYPPLMLLILSVFALPMKLFSIENQFAINLLFKIPLLISDLVMLLLLLKLYPNKIKRILVFYFLNPIIIYATYIHSQLDIIPTSLLFGAVVLLVNRKETLSAILLGIAIMTKTHVAAAFPMMALYIWNRFGFGRMVRFSLAALGVTAAVLFPVVFSSGFYTMVINNPKQSLIFESIVSLGKIEILVPVVFTLFIYFHFFTQRKINQDLMFFYLGILFCSLVISVQPAPAWYLWTFPYLSIYFIKSSNLKKALMLNMAIVGAYLIFFILFYQDKYHDILFLGNPIGFKISQRSLTTLFFSVLETILVAVMYSFYRFGIQSNTFYKFKNNLVIGIGGDSGSGKSTLMKSLRSILGDEMLEIEGDAEHRWERSDPNWQHYTHLNPKANLIHQQADIIQSLKNNKWVLRRDYDHETGRFSSPQKILPKHYIVISGLHPFYLPILRRNIDLKIFVDTDEKLRQHWKVLRDSRERGHSRDQILEQLMKRQDDSKKYIAPQRDFADLIIRFFTDVSFEVGDSHANIPLKLRLDFDSNIDVESFLYSLNVGCDWNYNLDLKTQYLILEQEPSCNFDVLSRECVMNSDEILSSTARFSQGYAGLIELLIVLSMAQKLRG